MPFLNREAYYAPTVIPGGQMAIAGLVPPLPQETMAMRFLSLTEESALVDATIRGRDEAWGALYEAFILPVRGFIAGRIGSPVDAEDLAEECFIRTRRSLEQGLFDPHYRLYTFLRSTAVHVVRDYWRKRAKAEDQLPETEGWERNTSVPQGTLFEPLERLELLRLVFVCGAKPHQIILFGLVKLLEWRPREIVNERSEVSLRSLGDEFLAGYYDPIEQFLSRGIFYDAYCSPLREALEHHVSRVYIEHEYDQIMAAHDAKVGDLPLGLFFGRDPAANISDWCDRVKNRTRKLISVTKMEPSHSKPNPETG